MAAHLCPDCGGKRDRRAIRCFRCAAGKTRADAWTAEEDVVVRDGAARGLGNREIAELLPGRTTQAVKGRAPLISSVARADRPWADAEVAEMLRLRAEMVPQPEIAAQLGRTTQAVAQRITKMGLPRATRSVVERFWEKVERRGDDECWPWTGAKDRKGYGQFTFSQPKRRVTASRAAYELTHEAIPAGLCVMHDCDNPPCCNPKHLRLGTIADNNRDMYEKGRGRGWGGRQFELARSRKPA